MGMPWGLNDTDKHANEDGETVQPKVTRLLQEF